MNKKIYTVLEFDKIIKQLSNQAQTSLGREICARLCPVTELKEAQSLQNETSEAMTSLRTYGDIYLTGLIDIRPHLKRSQRQGVLNISELFDILRSLKLTQGIKKYSANLATNYKVKPLFGFMDNLVITSELQTSLSESISENGEVLDTASDLLRQYRRQLLVSEEKIRNQIDRLLRSANIQKMLSDTLVTLRNDRFVLPVRQEYRNQFPGIIHDQSASGQTLFIEPQAIVVLNNELQNLHLKIKAEIDRILLFLTTLVEQNSEILWANINILANLDFMFAKARYGSLLKGELPRLNNTGDIDLKNAWHPLIDRETAVKNNLTMLKDIEMIIITGPNTGGKTVTLKTIGLCTLMAMAGLPISSGENSRVSIYRKVLADIGEEQSIEQNLSTFSAHMVNVVDILKNLDDNTLVLYDELGAGTDPGEGAALAMAILDESKERKAKTIATTHYSELKAYAYNQKNVMNVSVTFDVNTLSPTYKLIMGTPGKSNAFAISRKLGLSEKIIKNAHEMIGADVHKIENMIYTLEKERQEATILREKMEQSVKKTEMIRVQLEVEKMSLQTEREKILMAANQEASALLQKTKFETNRLLKEAKKASQTFANPEATKKIEQVNVELKKLQPTSTPKQDTRGKKVKAEKTNLVFNVGDEVKIISMQQTGTLIKKNSNNTWLIQLGIMKITIPNTDLQKINNKANKNMTPMYTVKKQRDNNAKFELDLRGERYEEAIFRTEKFIDNALLANYNSVSIIHGYGTGALRQGVRSYLEKHRAVKSVRFGGQGEGGMGVTIVELY